MGMLLHIDYVTFFDDKFFIAICFEVQANDSENSTNGMF